ncbi:MAG: MATE family efflux transporter [Bacteroidetes bacterium]|jgi:MATE family multidrug resistance protein|nr:MATE family efflux transporter [Bacteroidota bacterium]
MRGRLWAEIKKNTSLAIPVVLGQLGHIVTHLADAVMVGRLGAEHLAAASFANAVYSVLLVFAIGTSAAITTLVGNHHGANRRDQVIHTVGNGFWLLVIMASLLCLTALFTRPLLYHLGQPNHIVVSAVSYFGILSWSLLPLMGFLVIKNAFDGLEWTTPGMVISIVANLINIGLNYILIYGHLGIGPMGLNGAGLATLLARVLMLIMALAILYWHPRVRFIRFSLWKFLPSRKHCWEICSLGLPIGAQYLLEAGAFILAAIAIGWAGSQDLAAHQIAIGIASFTYMFATGIGAAATIRISNALGANQLGLLRIISRSLLLMILVVEAFFAISIVLLHNVLPKFFVADERVMTLAGSLLLVSALFQLADGVQVLLMGALRGLSDVRMPTLIALLSYWVISLPIGYWLMKSFELGAVGVWLGLLIGLSSAAILLAWRYFRLLKGMSPHYPIPATQPTHVSGLDG